MNTGRVRQLAAATCTFFRVSAQVCTVVAILVTQCIFRRARIAALHGELRRQKALYKMLQQFLQHGIALL